MNRQQTSNKVETAFNLFDIHHDGFITKEEFAQVIRPNHQHLTTQRLAFTLLNFINKSPLTGVEEP